MFWVHASNTARFKQSFQEIADCLRIPERQTPETDVFKLVHNWLRDEKRKWVVILDNTDDARFLVEAPATSHKAQANGLISCSTKPLFTYIPPGQNGSILITTRTRDVALELVEESDIITVEPMDKDDAVALLERKLGTPKDENWFVELAIALDFMPLALVQAAAYIRQRGPRCSVRQYIREFYESDRRKTSLLNYEAGRLRRDWEAKNSIIVTWQISFNHISRTRRSAADLLSPMSFFDRQGIPEALLWDRGDLDKAGRGDAEAEGQDHASELSILDQFEEDILMLRNYSFISINLDATTFEMHRLVQLATQK